MDFLSKKLNKWTMKASGMSDEAIKDMEEQQERMEHAYKTGGPTAAQEEHFRQMERMMEKAEANMSKGMPSIADELSKLAKLKADGTITEAEFQQMKQELMKRMT